MYAWSMMKQPTFRQDRLNELMARRKLMPGQLKIKSGVSQPMIHRLQNGERQNVSAVIVAQLAQALGCSVEYLVGITDDPSPKSIDLSDQLYELVQVAKELRSNRLVDLI